MKVLQWMIRTGSAFATAIVVWPILFFAVGHSFATATLFTVGSSGLVFYGLKGYGYYRYLKTQQLTFREHAYIRRNLQEAKGKIRRLRNLFLRARSLRMFRQVQTMNRLVRRIYNIVQKEPRRFYLAERFFFYHLDSMVELTEKYILLSSQPDSVQDEELRQSLQETQQMVDELIATVEDDLYHVLSTDIDGLTFELAVAKHTLNTDNQALKERRTNNE